MLVIVRVRMSVIVLMLRSGPDAGDAAQRRFRLRWHLARRQRVEQLVRDGGDCGDRPLERRSSGVRGLLDAAHLAHVLARRGLDLLVGGNGLQGRGES